ncbi:MAG: inositol monophosphatase family protein [Terriglobia bacterium]
MTDRALQAAVEIARQAGAILLDELAKPRQMEYKGGADIVTAADRRAEAFIVERLATLFPRHGVVGEEGSRRPGPDYCWYIDPLDGTTNFAHRFPFFCVSLGLFQGEEPLVGVVHDPSRDETFSAARGQGAWLNQKRIQVSPTERLAESLLATGFPTRQRHQSPNIRYYHRFTLISHGVRRPGSAALDLAALACGRLDGFWEFGLHPWDVAAGILLVREAGGLVSDLGGQPYHLGGEAIAASNGRIHSEMQEVFAEIARQRAAESAAPR